MLPGSMERALADLASRIPSMRRATSTGASLEVALGRVERPDMARSHCIEGPRITRHDVGAPDGPVCTAFLDGVQESRDVAWIGTIPIVLGRVAAVIRERCDGRLSTWGGDAVRRNAFYAVWGELPRMHRALFEEHGYDVREVGSDGPPDAVHPLRLMQDATNAVKQDREALERGLAEAFIRNDGGTLYLDGPLPSSPDVIACDRVLGVVKSHQTLYATGPELAAVLALQPGERSSVFSVESRHRSTVASWYLRVRPHEGRSPFWGLVRLEMSAHLFDSHGPRTADERSQWVLAEGSPVALPDGRWDTMAYGIRSCEEYLRAALG